MAETPLTDSKKAPASKAAAKPKSETRETLTFLLKLAVIVLIFRSFIFSPFSIPSESMLPRLLIGDYLFISKWNYGYSRWSLPLGVPLIPGRILARDPARGDVVVFRGPPGDDVDVIKRVIGLPGDTLQMRAGQLILNGSAIPKERVADFILPISPNYPAVGDVNAKCDTAHLETGADGKQVCRYKRFRETLPGGRSYDVLDAADTGADDTGVYTVPAGSVFVMGDNRDNSADSRFPAPADAMPGEAVGMGYVPMDHIQGKAVVGFFSTDGSASWLLPWTWFSAARWSRIGEGF
ncbi:signal peptidase I [Sphingomonas aliaeris]|uniref:Signal peptidase I n=1 Tax=Sphingomonas aliaeris TaxID=2759526 RepID=A0A974S3V2_9SPHN|nr:signal peptidase I [Sphingomonas aliaeris]QQV76948.1 signal peptidase I [Sphingomonas aliaeris]